MPREKKPKVGLSYYHDANGDWRWRMVAKNGRIIGASTEGYVRLGDAKANLQAVRAFDIRPVEIEGIY